MPVAIPCPHCRATLRVAEELLGRTAACPRCKGSIVLPAREAVGSLAPAAPVVAPSPPAQPLGSALPNNGTAVAPERRRKRRRKKSKKGLWQRLGLPPIVIERNILVAVAWLGGLLLFALVGYYGVRPALREPAPAVLAAERWQPFVVPGRLKVLMPGTPQETRQQIGEAPLVMEMCSPDQNSIFGIGYMTGGLPAHRRTLPAEVLLNDACNGALANSKGAKEVSRTSIQAGPYPGKELVMYVPRGRGQVILHAYLVSDRLYFLMAGGRGYETGHENLQKFFDSLEILDNGAPTPPAPAVVQKPPAVPTPPRHPALAERLRQRQGPVRRPQPQSKRAPFGAVGEIVLPADAGDVLALRYSKDGRVLAIGTTKERAFWFDAKSRVMLASSPVRPVHSTGQLYNCAISPDADRVAFLPHGGLVYFYERSDPATEVVLEPSDSRGMAQGKGSFSSDGKRLCTIHGDAKIRIWDVVGRKRLKELTEHHQGGGVTAWAPDDSVLATASLDLFLWDPHTYKLRSSAKNPGHTLAKLVFSPDGRILAGAGDQTISLWDISPNGMAATPRGQPLYQLSRVRSVGFSADGKLLLYALDDGRVLVTDLKTMKRRAELKAEGAGPASCLAVCAADGRLALGCHNRVLFVDLKKVAH